MTKKEWWLRRSAWSRRAEAKLEGKPEAKLFDFASIDEG